VEHLTYKVEFTGGGQEGYLALLRQKEVDMLMWGKHGENGIWRATRSARRLLWRGHDSLYIAMGRFRLRLMKPWRG
jgi:hypothetical protein